MNKHDEQHKMWSGICLVVHVTILTGYRLLLSVKIFYSLSQKALQQASVQQCCPLDLYVAMQDLHKLKTT